MTYDAVSAYTVLCGDGDGPATVSVHGSATEAWGALATLVAPRSRRRAVWHGRGAIDEDRIAEAAERWRLEDPEHRFWQVAPHRLQVTIPAIGAPRELGAS